MVTRLYPLNKQRKRLLICYSRKVAKTELYNERKREGRREEGEIEKAACSAGAGSVLSAPFFYIVARLYP